MLGATCRDKERTTHACLLFFLTNSSFPGGNGTSTKLCSAFGFHLAVMGQFSLKAFDAVGPVKLPFT